MAQVIQLPSGRSTPAEDVLGPIRERVEQGKRDRKRLEPTVHSNRAFAAGKPWLKWDRAARRLALDPRDIEGGRERTTVDLLGQYLGTGEGLLAGADDRRDLVFRKEDIKSEDFTKAANDAMAFGWEVEFGAPAALARTRRRILIDGTAAIRVRFDPTVGRELGDVPIGDGRMVMVVGAEQGAEPQQIQTKPGEPILDSAAAHAFVAMLTHTGETPRFKQLKEGRIVFEPLSFFNILVPPGLEDEELFPWEAIIDAVSIDHLIAEYGDKAQGLTEEPLAALEMLGVREQLDSSLGSSPEDADTPGKLDGHVARIRYYERPCREYPKGREVCFAGNRILHQADELPLKRANGDYASGIVYFRYKPVEGRFWGRSLVEPGKSPQRSFNKRVAQIEETINRGQPYVLAPDTRDEDDGLKKTSRPLEVVRFKPGVQPPQPVQGIGPGEWMWRSLEELRSELEEAMGIKGVEMGENPQNVNTYGQLQLLAEKARTKTGPIVEDFQAGVERIEECCVYLMRKYWPSDKVIAIVGEEDQAEAVEFKASKLPEFFRFKVAEGARSRSQAAEIQLITDVWNAATGRAGIAAHDPDKWMNWYVDSLKAGKMLPLPDAPSDAQLEKAQWQNSQLADGQPVQAAPWDEPAIHLPEHEQLRVELEMAGRDDLVQVVSDHIAADEQIAQQAQAAQAQAQADAAAQQAQQAQAQTAADQQAQIDQATKLEAIKAAGRVVTQPPQAAR